MYRTTECNDGAEDAIGSIDRPIQLDHDVAIGCRHWAITDRVSHQRQPGSAWHHHQRQHQDVIRIVINVNYQPSIHRHAINGHQPGHRQLASPSIGR